MTTGHTHPSFCEQCGASLSATAKFCRACGTSTGPLAPGAMVTSSLTTPTNANATRVLGHTLHGGHYQLIRLLGRGGMGAVYEATDLSLDRTVAIKEMSQSHLQPAEVAEAANAFKQEAIMLARLRHPNLPRIYAHFEEDGRWYLVMDFIEGQTLEELVKAAPGGRVPLSRVLDLGVQLCKVLDYLHTRQPPIVFRDLKPANVMCEAETMYLIDFGIARHFKPGQGHDTVALGSPGYAAPEQYGKAQTTPQSDLYSLGATLHALLSGIDPSLHPFHFASLIDGSQPVLPDTPAWRELNTLIGRMVALDPGQRPESVAVVKQALERISTASSPPSALQATQCKATATSFIPSSPAPGDANETIVTAPLAPTSERVRILCVEASSSGGVVWKRKEDLPVALALPFTMMTRNWGIDFTFLDIKAGQITARQTEEHIRACQLALLLVTPFFLASDSCDDLARKLMTRQRAGERVPLFPILPKGKLDLRGFPLEGYRTYTLKKDEDVMELSQALRTSTLLALSGREQQGPMSLFVWLLHRLELPGALKKSGASFQTTSGTSVRCLDSSSRGKAFQVSTPGRGLDRIVTIERMTDEAVGRLASALGAADGRPQSVRGMAV